MGVSKMAYLLGLALLVLLPVGELLLQLLDDAGDIALLHGRVDVDAAEVLDGADVELELALSLALDGSSGGAVAALLLLARCTRHIRSDSRAWRSWKGAIAGAPPEQGPAAVSR